MPFKAITFRCLFCTKNNENMPPILLLAIEVILIILLAYVGFWIVGKMALPDPANMIARVIVGVVCLLLLVALFVPSLGIGLRLSP
jgi:hypothetical protein